MNDFSFIKKGNYSDISNLTNKFLGYSLFEYLPN